MTFLKSLVHGARGILKQGNHYLDKLDGGIASAGKFIAKGKREYRHFKHKVEGKVPFSSAVFNALEESPLGSAVRTGVSTAQRGLRLADDAVDQARPIGQFLERQANNPAVDKFVHSM